MSILATIADWAVRAITISLLTLILMALTAAELNDHRDRQAPADDNQDDDWDDADIAYQTQQWWDVA